jgi:excinuclease ABC subunit B
VDGLLSLCRQDDGKYAKTIDETNRRRENKLFEYRYGITPRTIINQPKRLPTSVLDIKGYDPANPYSIAPDEDLITVAAEEQAEYKTIPQMEKAVNTIKKEMEKAARDLDFMEAARLRDEMFLLQKKLGEMKE